MTIRPRGPKVTDSQNQDRPLTQAAEVLGISLRMTEDELTRDMLASTASAVNATGGVNGRVIAVVKSSLIDLETLRGNKGQAVYAAA